MGPAKGISDIDKAQEAAQMPKTPGSFSPSAEITVTTTCVSCL